MLMLHWLLVKVHCLSGTRGNDGHWQTVVVVRVLCKVSMAMLLRFWAWFRLIVEEW